MRTANLVTAEPKRREIGQGGSKTEQYTEKQSKGSTTIPSVPNPSQLARSANNRCQKNNVPHPPHDRDRLPQGQIEAVPKRGKIDRGPYYDSPVRGGIYS